MCIVKIEREGPTLVDMRRLRPVTWARDIRQGESEMFEFNMSDSSQRFELRRATVPAPGMWEWKRGCSIGSLNCGFEVKEL
jgi:hypothetical protein